MPLFIWKPSYETGISEIDYDHRQLVGLINELYEAMKQGHGYEIVDRALDRLLEYANRHFATEEGFMRAGKYPHLAAHEQEHREFSDALLGMDSRRRAGKLPLSTEMMEFLCEWLRNHVTNTDKEMGRYLKRVSD